MSCDFKITFVVHLRYFSLDSLMLLSLNLHIIRSRPLTCWVNNLTSLTCLLMKWISSYKHELISFKWVIKSLFHCTLVSFKVRWTLQYASRKFSKIFINLINSCECQEFHLSLWVLICIGPHTTFQYKSSMVFITFLSVKR